MKTSVEVVAFEVVAFEAVVALETVVPFEATMPARVTTPAAVTAPGSRLAGHVDRKHDRECGERDECQLSRTRNPFHGFLTVSFHNLGRDRAVKDSLTERSHSKNPQIASR